MDTGKQLYDLVKHFNTAVLVSRSGSGLHARPMAVAEMKPDADIYFATGIDTPKVAEIEADPDVLVTFQSTTAFATLNGRVTVSRDRALIERLCSPAWKVWFPKGKDDPSICILQFSDRDAEYWDNGVLQGIKYVYEGAKAVLTRTRPEVDGKQHAKVKL